MKSKLSILLLIFYFIAGIQPLTSAQQTKNISAEGAFTPNGAFDNVFDMYGNKFALKDLIVGGHERNTSQQRQLSATSVSCSSGYFVVTFEAGSGMEGNSTIELERRNVVCQLFTDLSNFITPANPSVKVNIFVRNIANVPGIGNPASSGVLGLATSFYVLPNGSTAGGIVDNEIWKTINSGTDSYTNVASPLSTQGINQTSAGSFYHGYMAFNFSNPTFNWHTDLSQTTAANAYDLYSVVLHEVTHALGFASLINFNGQSKFGTGFNYFSRYDLFLKTQANQPLITNSGSCSLYGFAFNSSLNANTVLSPNPSSCGGTIPYNSSSDNTNCSTAINYAGSITQKVYTPDCFEPPSSLSHFEDQCQVPATFIPQPPASNNLYFNMSNANGTGFKYMKRYLKPEERSVLCDLGYKVSTTYGNNLNSNNFKDYNTTVCGGLQVAGVNDGINSGGAYTYIGANNSSIPITNVLGNDFNAVSFECMQVVLGTGSLSATAGTSCNYIPSTLGVHLLRYIPVAANGNRGNITYIFVYSKSGNCTPSACNIVNNGEFETAQYCGSMDPYNNIPTPVVNCWDPLSFSPDLYSRGCSVNGYYPDGSLPTNLCSPAGDTWSGPPNNNKMIGLWTFNTSNGYLNEGLQGTLNGGLQPNTTYILSFRARVANNFSSTQNVPTTFLFTGTPGFLATIGFFSSTPASLTTLATATIPNNNQWNYFSIPITTSQNLAFLQIFNAGYLNTTPANSSVYGMIDDISILPASQAPTFNPPSPICLSQTIPDLSLYVSVPNGTFSGPGVSSSGGTYSFNASSLGAGTYTVSYTYTNNLGCTGSIAASIVVTSGIVITPSAPSICKGQSVTLTASGGTNYSWSPSVSCTAPCSTVTVSPTITTTYTVLSPGSGCNQSSVVVTVNPVPTITATASPTLVCSGSPATLTASGGVSYHWSNNSNGNPITVNPTVTTTYTVTGTNSGGCSNTANVVVQVIPAPVANAGPDKAVCAGSCTTIGIPLYQIGVNYSWSPTTGLTTPNAPSSMACPSATTTYTLTATNIFNGCSSKDQVVVFVNLKPVINATASPTMICSGSSSTLTASGGVSYHWSTGSNANPITVTPAVTTTYTVTGTDANGCTNTAKVVVTVRPKPPVTATANPSTICAGGKTLLTASGAQSYHWSTGSSGNPISVAPTVTTTYTVTGTDANGCTNAASVVVTVNQGPGANAGPDKTVCAGSCTTVGIPLYQIGVNYSWSPTTGLTTPNAPSSMACPSATTTYTLTTTNWVTGCSSKDQVVVFVNPKPGINATANPTMICSGSSSTLTASGGVSYHWSTGSNANPITVTPAVTTTYTVTGTDANGCTNTAKVVVTVRPKPPVTATANPSTICAGGKTLLTASGAQSYHWSTGSSGNPISVAPTVTTTYTVTGTDANGCTNAASVVVTVNQGPGANAGPDKTVCAGSCTTIGIPLYQIGVNYSWSPTTGLTTPNAPGTTACPTATTTYTLTTTNWVTGCSSKDQVVVFVNPKPVIQATASPNTICAGGSSTLTASGGVSYHWSTGSNANPITVTPTVTTTYTVTGTDANGCTNIAKAVVTVSGSGGWPKTAGSANQITDAHSVVTDGQGNVYATGDFDGFSLTFGSVTINTVLDGWKFYLVKYDACGNVQWVAYGTHNNTSTKVFLDVNPAGNLVYISGMFNTQILIVDGVSGTQNFSVFSGVNAMHVTAFNTNNGSFAGFTSVTGGPPTAASDVEAHGLTVTNNGVYVALTQLSGNTTTKSIVEFDATLTSVLNIKDVSSINRFTRSSSIDSDPNGNIFLTGQFIGTLLNTTVTAPALVVDMFIVKFNPTLQNILWAQSGNSTPTTTVLPSAMYVNATGIYVTGIYAANGGGPFNGAVTGNGGFLTRYNDLGASGTRVWGVKTTNNTPVAVAADAATHVYTVGHSFVEHRNAANGSAALTAAINAGAGMDIYYNSSLTNPAFFVTGDFSAPITLNSPISPMGTQDMYTARIIPGSGAYFRAASTEQSTNESSLNSSLGSLKFNVDVHPNPITNSVAIDLLIETRTKVEISLVDITGKVLKKTVGTAYEKGEHTIEMDCSGLSAGIYFIRVNTGNNSIVKKVVKL